MRAEKRLSKHGRDKIMALLRSVASDCQGADEHSWVVCRHCLAVQSLDAPRNRQLLRAFLGEQAGDRS